MILSPHANSLQGVDTIEIRAEQLQQIGAIAITYKNLECIECAQAIKNYFINQGFMVNI
jgi:hypothetical protein